MDFSKQPDDSPDSIRTESRGTRVPAPDHVDPSVKDVNAEVTDPGSPPARGTREAGRRERSWSEPAEQSHGTSANVPPARSAARGTVSANREASTPPVEDSPNERTQNDSHWELRPHGLKPGQVHDRWNHVQSDFVDDPQTSIREADALAAEVAEAVVTELEERRTKLRSTWEGAGIEDTETLRLALRDYRSFVRHLSGEPGRV